MAWFRRLPRPAARPRLELLEGREVPATFTVTNTDDAGPGSLRQAVADAEAADGLDDIVFQPGLVGTITLTTGQIEVTGPLRLLGPGAGVVTVSGNDQSRILAITDAAAVTVSGLTFTRGVSPPSGSDDDGGAIRAVGTNLTLEDMAFVDNIAEGEGGAVVVNGDFALTVRRSLFSGNLSGNADGGAIATTFNGSRTVIIEQSTFTGNVADEDGGALYLQGTGEVIIRDSLFDGNTSADAGGGVSLRAVGTHLIEGSTFIRNLASENNDGGGIDFSPGSGRSSLTVRNVTVTDNIAGDEGGGIAIRFPFGVGSSATALIENSTITDNRAARQGGGVFVRNLTGEVTLRNSIVSGNQGRGSLREVYTSPSNARLVIENSLVQNPGAAVFIDGGGNLFGVDPRLGPLQDNGGPTPTRLPLPGSPVIDAGNAAQAAGIPFDQRGPGFPRVVGGGLDLGAVEVQPPPPPPPPPPPAPPPPALAAGAGLGGGQAVLLAADGSAALSVAPFGDAFAGGIRVATADFTGDGVLDLVVGNGPGITGFVQVYDGDSGNILFGVSPFEASFTGGVYVAAGDITGDGVPELVVTPDQGGGGRVIVYTPTPSGFAVLADFLGIDDPAFRGGARAAVGDIDGDGFGDLVVAAGFGGGPRVAVYDGQALAGGSIVKLINDLFVFEESLRNGSFVAVADINGDGFGDLIAGAGPGGGPRVVGYSGQDLLAGRQVFLANFFAGDEANRNGVPLAVADFDDDGAADLLTGTGEPVDAAGNPVPGTAAGSFTVYPVAGLDAATPEPLDSVIPFGESFTGGVFVG